MIKQEQLRTRTGSPFCGAIPLRIVLRLLIMFAPQFLWVELLGFEQR
jgi:hypothetical protein